MALVTFGPIETAPVPGSKTKRRVVWDIPVYLWGVLVFVIPAGFVGDGMSFPLWQATWDDPWHVRYAGPSLLHDYLLDLKAAGLLPAPFGGKKWGIDWLFEGALRSQGVSALETWIFTNAVRTRR